MALPRLRLVSPCFEPWEGMQGDDRVRHCGTCDKNVYDSKGMTAGELERLIAAHEGRPLPCLRLHRRLDGTIITRDCLTPMRRAAAWLRVQVAVAAGVVLALFSGIAAAREMPAREAGAAATPAKAKRSKKRKAPPKPPPFPVVKKKTEIIDSGGFGLEL